MKAAPGLFLAVVLAVLGAAPAEVCRAADGNARWDFLRTNLDVFPGTEKIFEPDELLFWRLKANLSKVRAAEKLPDREFRFRVSTDAAGRRVTQRASEAAPEVLFLGDSCTFGIPVDDREAFPALVGEMLGVQAINAGVPGYSAFQGRVLLENLSERPRAVVIAFWMNGRTSWDHLSDAEHRELLAAERAGEFSRHRLTRLLRRVTPGVRPRLTEQEFVAELHALISRSRAMDAAPILVIWPTAGQMEGAEEHPRQALIRQVGSDTGTSVVELEGAFRASGSSRLFVDPVHATARGYRIAAERIADALRPLLQP